MKPLVAVIVGLGAIALVVAAGFYIVDHGHFEEYERDVDPSVEAVRNPLLACERMLTRIGLPAESHRVVAALPANDHVLIVVSDGSGIARTTRSTIVDWVNSGGHLVIALPNPKSPRLTKRDGDAVDPPRKPFELDFDFSASKVIESVVGVHTLTFDADTVDVAFGDCPDLATPELVGTGFGSSTRAAKCISYAHGGGRVTVLASDAPLRNGDIANHDHAEFAARIATLDARTRAAWIVFGFDESVGFLRRLWSAAWPALSALIAFAALWAWRAGRRFGPVIETPPDDHRDFADHVRATGSFLTRHRAFATLIAAPRLALHATIRRRRPDLVGCSDDALHRELARIAGIGVPLIRDALLSTPSAHEFVRQVRTLEHVRRSL